MMIDWKILFGAGVTVLLLSGCATKPTIADAMRDHAGSSQARADLKKSLAKSWEQGQKLVITGEARVKSGESRIESAEKQIEKGKKEIEKGNQEISGGTKAMRDSESRFRAAFPDETLEMQK